MRVRLLDCTLRDGGYINDWDFGESKIKSIISMLTAANIEIIECGFLQDEQKTSNISLFSNITDIRRMIPNNRRDSEYVAMVNYGGYSVERLEECDGSSITGIRVVFHDNEIKDALQCCLQIKQKGYKAFVQPMGTDAYTDKQLIHLIEQVNEINPFAFYIVDTLGIMDQNDITRISYLLDNNLNPSIAMGFHSHNNLQLAFSNAQHLLDMKLRRELIIDASVYGMGRGAGNLTTELIANSLNQTSGKTYNVDVVLRVIDEHINPIRTKYEWGYSIPYYLAGIHKCHPNYATYLIKRATLPVTDVGIILSRIPVENKRRYSEQLINELYFSYQTSKVDDTGAYASLRSLLDGRPVMLLAPGKTAYTHKRKIKDFIADNNPVIISINHENKIYTSDFAFYSNRKRYEESLFRRESQNKTLRYILTSNIRREDESLVVDYTSLCSGQDRFSDNAAVLLLTMLMKIGMSRVYCAGLDGYTSADDYYDRDLQNVHDEQWVSSINKAIKAAISRFSSTMEIHFLTPSLYE